jgi:DNA-binding CsgD family transcriptional regulator
MRLLEREAALADLAAALDQAIAGSGAVAMVSGEAGVGKTSLLRAFTAEAAAARTLIGGCDDLAVPRALGPFLEIADQVPRLANRIEQEPVGAPSAVLDELRRDGPTLCIVEDAHWADEATLDVIHYVARRVEDVPALVVISFRDDEVGPDHPLRRALAAAPAARTRRIPLQPLSPAAVGILAGPGVDAASLYAVTGGNPFFVTEALSAGDGPTPPSVRDAVLSRVTRLGPDGREAAELVSVVPAQAERWLVDECLDAADVGLVDCEERGLLVIDGSFVRYRHELARRAVEEALPAARRAALNRTVLQALDRRGSSAARLAHHAWQADDADALVRHGFAAGREAAAARSHREAIDLLGRVARHDTMMGDEQRAELLELLSVEAYHGGEPEVAMRAREEAVAIRRELADPVATGAGLRWLSRIRWWARDRAGADEAADEAIRLLEEAPPGRELALALSNRSQLSMLAQRDADAIPWGERAIALADELGDIETLVHAQNNLGTALLQASLGGRVAGDAARGQALLDESAARAIEAGLDEHACRAFVNSAWMANDEARYADARRIADEGLAFAREREQVAFEEYLAALDALIDLETGDWARAEATAQALVSRPTLRQTVERIPALEVLGLIRARRGEPGARELLDEAWAFAESTRELQRIRPIACARAELAWLGGDLDAVDAATRDAYRLALEVGNLWDIGKLALWRHRAGVPEDIPAGLPAPFAREIAGDPAKAAAAWADLGVPYHRALALMQAGDPDSLLEAVAVLDALGATAVANLARDLARRAGAVRVPRGPRAATRENPVGLTVRQMQVLELIAQGLSNSQIADRLVVSPKTVEHHVAAILDKLGAANRGEAVEAARTLGVPLGPKPQGT